MRRDPIVEEIRESREAIAREFGDDLFAIVAAFQRQDAESGVKTVSLPAKRISKPPARRRKIVKPSRPNKAALQPSSRAGKPPLQSKARARAARG